MATDSRNDLVSFHAFVKKQLDKGQSNLTPDEVLALWREQVETAESIKRSLADIEAGRTEPADAVIDRLRNELKQ